MIESVVYFMCLMPLVIGGGMYIVVSICERVFRVKELEMKDVKYLADGLYLHPTFDRSTDTFAAQDVEQVKGE